MNIVLAYICVAGGGQKTHDYAARFVGTYLEFNPGIEHRTFIVCNGGLPPNETQMLFLPLPNCVLYPRLNDKGWDVSGYQEIARKVPCDLMFCFGESVYFHKQGWGRRLAETAERFGEGMYGVFASNLVRGHLNTTAFACTPKFLAEYPQVRSHPERYEFEHGTKAMWRRIQNQRKPTKLVTWDGVWEPKMWRIPQDILWKGDQSNCLAWCNHTDRYRNALPHVQINWSRAADQQFK